MPVWAWILLTGGLVGMLGATLIAVAIYEFTRLPFRRWDTLP